MTGVSGHTSTVASPSLPPSRLFPLPCSLPSLPCSVSWTAADFATASCTSSPLNKPWLLSLVIVSTWPSEISVSRRPKDAIFSKARWVFPLHRNFARSPLATRHRRRPVISRPRSSSSTPPGILLLRQAEIPATADELSSELPEQLIPPAMLGQPMLSSSPCRACWQPIPSSPCYSAASNSGLPQAV